MGVLMKTGSPRFEFSSLVKLAQCTKALRAAGNEVQIQECLRQIVLDILPASYGVVALFDPENAAVQAAQHVARLTGVGQATAALNDSVLLSLYMRWREAGGFLSLNLDECRTLDDSLGGMIAVDGINGQNSNVCVYALLCEPSALGLCQVVMDVLLPEIQKAFVRAFENRRATNATVLTGRELEILKRIKCGFGNKSIAMQLNISVNTVKSHIYNVYRKLEVNNRVEALIVVEKAGVLLP